LFLVLVESLTKSQTFSLDSPKLSLIRATKLGLKGEKTWFSRVRSGITYFICTNTVVNLISNLNWGFW